MSTKRWQGEEAGVEEDIRQVEGCKWFPRDQRCGIWMRRSFLLVRHLSNLWIRKMQLNQEEADCEADRQDLAEEDEVAHC